MSNSRFFIGLLGFSLATGFLCYDIGAKHGFDRGFNAGFGLANSTLSSEVEAAEIERQQALMDVQIQRGILTRRESNPPLGIGVMHHDNDPMIAAGFSPAGEGSIQWRNAVTGEPRGTYLDSGPATIPMSSSKEDEVTDPSKHILGNATVKILTVAPHPAKMTILGSNGKPLIVINLKTGRATLHGSPNKAARVYIIGQGFRTCGDDSITYTAPTHFSIKSPKDDDPLAEIDLKKGELVVRGNIVGHNPCVR